MKLLSICIFMLLSMNIFAFEGQPKSGFSISHTGEEKEFYIKDFSLDNLFMKSCDTSSGQGEAEFVMRQGERLVIRYGEEIFFSNKARIYYSVSACSFRYQYDIVYKLEAKSGNTIELLLEVPVVSYDVVRGSLIKDDLRYDLKINSRW